MRPPLTAYMMLLNQPSHAITTLPASSVFSGSIPTVFPRILCDGADWTRSRAAPCSCPPFLAAFLLHPGGWVLALAHLSLFVSSLLNSSRFLFLQLFLVSPVHALHLFNKLHIHNSQRERRPAGLIGALGRSQRATSSPPTKPDHLHPLLPPTVFPALFLRLTSVPPLPRSAVPACLLPQLCPASPPHCHAASVIYGPVSLSPRKSHPLTASHPRGSCYPLMRHSALHRNHHAETT